MKSRKLIYYRQNKASYTLKKSIFNKANNTSKIFDEIFAVLSHFLLLVLMIIPAKTNKPYILPPKVTIYGGIFLPMLFNCF